jgi:hypothetical protein
VAFFEGVQTMSDEQTERIIITVDDQYLEEIQAVATALQSAGMRVEQVMPISGIITGEISPQQRQNLYNVTGVADIETDEEMRAI